MRGGFRELYLLGWETAVAHACQSSVTRVRSVIGCQSSVSQKRTSMKRAQVNRGRRLTAVHILSNSNQQTWLELHLLTFPSSCRCNSSQFPSHFPLQCASSAIQANKSGWSCIFSPYRHVVGATPASFQATSQRKGRHPHSRHIRDQISRIPDTILEAIEE